MQNILNIISLVLFSHIASISFYILSLSVFNYLVSNYEMLEYYIINYGFIITSIVYFITFPLFISTNYIAYIEKKNGMKH